ncbi:hypothetical protein [Cellulomonas telluris]|uniref:hypothetical protein n=1 Tax=Cellulomonas telluris TaxID=2306636 RepID=UPI0010A8D399|nr:hypothetical protein [Cellulomonas telluris]
MRTAAWWSRVRGMLDPSITVVVFTVPEKRLREMDTATGPCVPTGNRRRALAGPTRQDDGELPRHTAALYTALTGRPADDALVVVDRAGPGVLHRCSDAFVDAMAAANEEMIRLADDDDADGDRDLTRFVRRFHEVGRAWLCATQWPRDVVDVSGRLGRLGWARLARERGHPLYAWHGPSRPAYGVVFAPLGDPGRR